MANFFQDYNARKGSKIKAIETKYKGYKMRSRLEARWAVFFDSLKIEWIYEPEGFKIGGKMYLPDFYLPNFSGGMFVEVKFKATSEEIAICKKLSDLTQKSFLICEGPPSGQSLKYFYPDEDYMREGFPKYDHAYEENRMWDSGGQDICDFDIMAQLCEYTKAINLARSKRFEHNEFNK